MLYNKRAIEKILTAIYLDNDLLVSPEYPFKLNDFALKKYQAIYSAMYNLYTMGNSEIDISDVIGYFQQQSSLYSKFVEDGGVDSLYEICNDLGPTNFLYNYNTIKKYSLLNDLNNNGIDISDIFNEDATNTELEQQLAKFNAMTVEDIFKHYALKINKLQNSYSNFLEKSCISGSEGIEELFKTLQTLPEVGLPLDGDIFNTITRGARTKKLYIDSGATGTGKSRRMVGNACHLAIPMYYDTYKEEWINTGLNQKVLYVTTELDHAEVQTLMMAYVSGVNEEHILNNRYIGNEKERVELAIQYIIQNNNLIIEVFPNPDLVTISANIKKHVLQDDVKYVFYDYIHITSGLVQDRDKQMRDDVILMLLSSTLKELANELDIHISSATQLNGEYEDKEIKNQNIIRGSKSIADKADIGVITLPTNKAEEELGSALSLKLQTPVPNMITDVYKNRRGKWTGVRIWRYVDLGTCRVTDCFITDRRNEPIDFDSMKIQVKQANHSNGFVITSNKPVETYADLGTEVRAEDYVD